MKNRDWLAPLAVFYSLAMDVRHWSYRRGWLSRVSVAKPVVSIGNLTMGGTGKTPVVSFLLEWCESQKFSVGVVSRGYRGRVKGVERVDVSKAGPSYFGDEPFWYGLRFPQIPVFVGSDRARACEVLIEQKNVDVIVSDDGFQHLRLKRDVDVVLFDATEDFGNYHVVPWGRARESFSNLRRADIFIITKANLVNLDRIESLKARLAPFEKPILIADLKAGRFTSLASFAPAHAAQRDADFESGTPLSPSDILKNQKILLVSGIGNPKSFENLVRAWCGCEGFGHLAFADHQSYTENEVAEILERKMAAQATLLITTEKDAVKLSQTSLVKHNDCFVLGIQVQPRTSFEPLYELIRKNLH